MIIILGLGNPPDKYKGTRHNAGFMVLDELAASIASENDDQAVKWTNKDHREELKLSFADQSVLLVKPTEFMNVSGQAARTVMDFYRVPLEKVWVVYDDVNVDLGTFRIRQSGSSGGHKGVESVIQHLGGGDFPRVRVGIGPIPEGTSKQGNIDDNDLTDFVLGRFSPKESKVMAKVSEEVATILKEAIISGELKDTTARV